jgi:hypothetical protein
MGRILVQRLSHNRSTPLSAVSVVFCLLRDRTCLIAAPVMQIPRCGRSALLSCRDLPWGGDYDIMQPMAHDRVRCLYTAYFLFVFAS